MHCCTMWLKCFVFLVMVRRSSERGVFVITLLRFSATTTIFTYSYFVPKLVYLLSKGLPGSVAVTIFVHLHALAGRTKGIST